jgi:hypothetical protein
MHVHGRDHEQRQSVAERQQPKWHEDSGGTVRFDCWTRLLRASNAIGRAWLTHNFNGAGATAFAQRQVIGSFRRRRHAFLVCRAL